MSDSQFDGTSPAFESRRLSAALADLRTPATLAALRLLADTRAAARRLDEALALQRLVCEVSDVPDDWQRYVGMLIELGRARQALELFDRGAPATPGWQAWRASPVAASFAARAQLGDDGDGEPERARQRLDEVPSAQRDGAWWQASAEVEAALRRPVAAIEAFQRALADASFCVRAAARLQVQRALADAYLAIDRPMAAVQALDLALAEAPDDAASLASYGLALARLGEPAAAVWYIEQALASDPEYAPAYRYLAGALVMQREDQAALDCLAQARRLKPDWHDAWLDEAGILLRRGDLLRGFAAYERREGARLAARRSRAFWNGSDELRGASLFVAAEQGFGDMLQFVRYAPLLTSLARHVTIEVQAALWPVVAPMAARWGVTVQARGQEVPPCDRFTLMMTLPYALRTRLDTIPAEVPYLAVPAGPAESEAALPPPTPRGGRRLRVGLVPSGNPQYHNDAQRSMPLATLAPLAEFGDVEFWLVQPTVRDSDAEALAQWPTLHRCDGCLNDFGDMARLLARLDLVISVDTAVAHLAGALGRPVWIMLPYVADWRWLAERTDSPWYPSARLFRQDVARDWHGVARRIAEALRTETARG